MTRACDTDVAARSTLRGRPFRLTLTYSATLPVVWIYPQKWVIRGA